MTCTKCGVQLNQESKFCSGCGEAIVHKQLETFLCGTGTHFTDNSKLCDMCGTQLNQENKFCAGCGTAVVSVPKPGFCTDCGAYFTDFSKSCCSCMMKKRHGEPYSPPKPSLGVGRIIGSAIFFIFAALCVLSGIWSIVDGFDIIAPISMFIFAGFCVFLGIGVLKLKSATLMLLIGVAFIIWGLFVIGEAYNNPWMHGAYVMIGVMLILIGVVILVLRYWKMNQRP